jgi:hypothetical protein
LQQSNNQSLSQFGDTLNAAIDEQLLQLVRDHAAESNRNSSNPSVLNAERKISSLFNKSAKSKSEDTENINFLLGTCSEALMRILATAPSEMEACWVMFINRPLPLSLRPFLWLKRMRLEQRISSEIATNKNWGGSGFGGKLPPSIDVLFSRRCHILLDK